MARANQNRIRRSELLSGPPVQALRLPVSPHIKWLVNIFGASSYVARNLAKACRIYERMLKNDATVFFTFAGAMTPAGMGGIIGELIELGFVDAVITTGANVTHDLHFAFGDPVVQGQHSVNDAELREVGVERIYDTYLAPKCLTHVGDFNRDFAIKEFSIKESEERRTLSSADYYFALGKAAAKKAKHPKSSFLIQAARAEVPVYTPAFGDSELGMGYALAEMDVGNKGYRLHTVDPTRDVIEEVALVYCSKKNAGIAIGGGVPKNSYTQTQPLISEDLLFPSELETLKGHEYFIKITTDTPQYGGCSGAPPSENISWKKLDPHILRSNSALVYADATVAFRIIAAYVKEVAHPRKLKRLYCRIPQYVKKTLARRKMRLARYGVRSFREG